MNWFLRYFCLEFLKDFVRICKFFRYFLSFSEFNEHYWPTNFSKSRNGLLDRTFETKIVLNFFIAKLRSVF